MTPVQVLAPSIDSATCGVAIVARLDDADVASLVYELDAGRIDTSRPLRCARGSGPRATVDGGTCAARTSIELVEKPSALFPWEALFRRIESDATIHRTAGVPLLHALTAHDLRAHFLLADATREEARHDGEAVPRRCELFESYVRWGSARGIFELEFGSDTDPALACGVGDEEAAHLVWLWERILIEVASWRPSELSIWVQSHGTRAAQSSPPSPSPPSPTPHIRIAEAPSREMPRRDLAYDNQEWWRLVTSLSEAPDAFERRFGGRQSSVEFGIVSNEDSAQYVIPALRETVQRGGVYVGVGPEQNFTYIAAIQPALAFIVDIRRDNLIAHLMYKALFELSADRADFVSRLFSRRRPAGVGTGASVTELFAAYQGIEADLALYDDTLRAIVDCLVRVRACPLNDADRADLARTLKFFATSGPCSLKGAGSASNRSYAELMSATDRTGHQQSYLASEESFTLVRELQRRNLIVPLLGDVAGDTALAGIGRHLREREMPLSAFYLSNVERYLFDRDDRCRQFYENVAALPLQPASVFIRSVSSDISRRLGIRVPIGAEKWRTFLSPIPDALTGVADRRIQTYRDLFHIAR